MVNFEDGELVKGAYVVIDGKEYEVHMPQYSGKTPLSSENLNKMQKDLKDKIEQINNSRTYSTEEVNTGKKWINGKDVYSKTYTGECNSGSSQTIANSLKDIDTVIKIEGTFQRKSDTMILALRLMHQRCRQSRCKSGARAKAICSPSPLIDEP